MRIEFEGRAYEVHGRSGGAIKIMDLEKGIGWGYVTGREPGSGFACQLAEMAEKAEQNAD